MRTDKRTLTRTGTKMVTAGTENAGVMLIKSQDLMGSKTESKQTTAQKNKENAVIPVVKTVRKRTGKTRRAGTMNINFEILGITYSDIDLIAKEKRNKKRNKLI